jgi:hypothetical protein
VERQHRNSVRQPQSVALYRWPNGVGFFPNLLVAVQGHKATGGVALGKFKGSLLKQYYKKMAGPCMHYGRVFMVDVDSKNKKELRLFRLVDSELVDDGL